MQRRALLAAVLASPLATRASHAAAVPGEWRQFEVTTRIRLLNSPGVARLWVPLAQTDDAYQKAHPAEWNGNGATQLLRDERYGAGMLYSVWAKGDAGQQIESTQRVVTRDRAGGSRAPLTDAERRFWLAPSPTVPTDGIVRDTAMKITAGQATPLARLRAIYDWVVDTTWRDPNTPGCGTGDVRAMLESGHFGGKCADINGLMVALARGAGIPARDVYGIRVADSAQFPSIGRSGDISKAQHCRAEAYIDGEGWFAVDPADVRKVVLEQKLTLDDPAVRALRDRLFGHWEMNWIAYNSATDIELPGATGQRPNFAFLMYPCAFTALGQADCVDPGAFSYQITSREITA